jgi:hypothetical protein
MHMRFLAGLMLLTVGLFLAPTPTRAEYVRGEINGWTGNIHPHGSRHHLRKYLRGHHRQPLPMLVPPASNSIVMETGPLPGGWRAADRMPLRMPSLDRPNISVAAAAPFLRQPVEWVLLLVPLGRFDQLVGSTLCCHGIVGKSRFHPACFRQQPVSSTGAVTTSIQLSAGKSAQESVWVRFSTNSFSTSLLIPAGGSSTNYTANLPAQSAGTRAYYYVLTSTMPSNVITGITTCAPCAVKSPAPPTTASATGP